MRAENALGWLAEFAEALDATDELAHLRASFIIPQVRRPYLASKAFKSAVSPRPPIETHVVALLLSTLANAAPKARGGADGGHLLLRQLPRPPTGRHTEVRPPPERTNSCVPSHSRKFTIGHPPMD
jgi:hypothetical protein